MSDLALAVAGVVVFALTTWASLAFGYQVFQNMWETEQAEGAAPDQQQSDGPAIPLLVADAPKGGATDPNEFVPPAAPAA